MLVCEVPFPEMAPEASFVLKRGEGLHNANMIKHKVLLAETSRASSDMASGPGAARRCEPSAVEPKPVIKSSYVSPMQRAREQKKRRGAGGQSKDWDAETSSGTSTSLSSNGTPSSKPARVNPYSGNLIPRSGNLIPRSGNLIPNSGYIAKVRDSAAEVALNKSGHLPKFGVWDTDQNDASGPCYTLLFENVAQEKRIGGPIRARINRSESPSRTDSDLYSFNAGAIKARKSRMQLHHGLLCCFVGS